MELVADKPVEELDDFECRKQTIISRILPIIASVVLSVMVRFLIPFLERIKKRKKFDQIQAKKRTGCGSSEDLNLVDLDSAGTATLKNNTSFLILKKQDKNVQREKLKNVIFEFIRHMDILKQTHRIMNQETEIIENNEVFYDSQTHYRNGAYMCTPTCILFATAVVGMDVCSCPPTHEQMNCIMESASKIQTLLLSLQEGNHMFSIKDVINHIKIPSTYTCVEIVGSIARLPPDFIQTFEDENDQKHCITDLCSAIMNLKDNSAIVLTLRNQAHTIAVYRESSSRHWYFDPLVAVTKDIGDSNTALFEIFKKTKLSSEFTGLFVSKS